MKRGGRNTLRFTDPTGLDVGNPGNDGYDENGNPIVVTAISVNSDGDDICVTITTEPGNATNENEKESMKETPGKKETDVILVKDKEVVSCNIDGGVPPGFNIFDNINQVKAMTAFDFYNTVRNGGLWDYKQIQSDFQNFGNWNFGLTGRAFGWSIGDLLRGAGIAQIMAKTSRPGYGFPFFNSPYGDDPNDQAWIKAGIGFYTQVFLASKYC